MKPITGSVVSSKPVSLLKAASILSRFVSSETGAHQDVSAYLRRTSESFDELVRFHQELEAKRDSCGHKLVEEEEVVVVDVEGKKESKKKKKKKKAVAEAAEDGNVAGVERNPNPGEGFRKEGNVGVLDFVEGRSGRREQRRADKREGQVGGDVVEVEEGEGNNSERRKKKKRKKEEGVEEGGGGGIEDQSERHHKKKKKRKVIEED